MNQCHECGHVFSDYETGVVDNDGRPEKCCPFCESERFGALQLEAEDAWLERSSE